MKKIFTILTATAALAFASSCELDYYPSDGYNEHNVEVSDDGNDDPYQTREDIRGALDAMYNNIKSDVQESFYSDFLIYTDVLADNAYCGSPSTGEIYSLEMHTQDGTNKNIVRDWNVYMNQVGNATEVTTYIDGIEDATLTDSERKQWKAEAQIWRCYVWFNMSLLWGDIPMIDSAPPAITADNISEVYHLYYPSRTEQVEAFTKIAAELEEAVQYAPDLSTTDKFVCSKAFGYGVLARLYAEKPIQDWDKVAQYCTTIENMNLSLVPSFSDLWSWNEDRTDMVARHSSESIFEVPYTKSNGNWVWMMFWRNGMGDGGDANTDSFSWAKWVTPSRNLAAAYDAEGDTERKNQTIKYDQCGWSNFYPADDYAFMYKTRCNASSIIKMRLAEIYLLHAEALANKGDFGGVKTYVDMVRNRAGLNGIAVPAGKDAAIDAILHERRLELAFEGHRWFDLVRNDRAVECVNNLNVSGSEYYDSAKPVVRAIDENGLLMPVPDVQLENNPNLSQNIGY